MRDVTATNRSGWTKVLALLPFFYCVVLVVFSAYLLRLPSTFVLTSPDTIKDITGILRITGAMLGGFALVALVASVGLWREKQWGWWLATVPNLGLAAIFGYVLVGGGWRNANSPIVFLLGITVVPVVALLLPRVRKFYWRSHDSSSESASVSPPRF